MDAICLKSGLKYHSTTLKKKHTRHDVITAINPIALKRSLTKKTPINSNPNIISYNAIGIVRRNDLYTDRY